MGTSSGDGAVGRRGFLLGAGLSSATVVVPGFWRGAYGAGAVPGDGPYGVLGTDAGSTGWILPKGFEATVLATSGQPVGAGGEEITWHGFPDGGATFGHDDGGWTYVSNSEIGGGAGGVGALRFDADGTLVGARRICSDTSRNCAGGPTPWGTWLTCEEVPTGRVVECDPTGEKPAVPRPALGRCNHEAVAVDPEHKHLYLSHDDPDGRFWRFTPASWPSLDEGVLAAATVAGDGSVRWVAADDVPADAEVERPVGTTPFAGGEGLWYDEGTVFLTTKGDNRVWAYDTAEERITVLYDRVTSKGPLSGVDNITRSAANDLFVCEDGGNMELVVISAEREVAPFGRLTGQDGSELTGVAFSPNGKHLYVSSQRGTAGNGITYAISGPFRAASSTGSTGRAELPAPASLPSVDGDGDGPPWPIIGAAGVVTVAAVGGAVALRRRRSPSPVTSVGPDGAGDGPR